MPIIKKKWEDMTPEERAITAQEERRGYAGIVRAAEGMDKSAIPKRPVNRKDYLRWLRRVMGKIGKRETGTEMARGAGGLGR